MSFFSERGHVWRDSEVDDSGVSLIRALVDTLWTIDGHHDTLRSRSYPISEVFGCFSGYNVPEKSKHQKWTIQNLSFTTLHHAQMLSMCVYKGLTGQGTTGMNLNPKSRHFPSPSLNIVVICLNSVLLVRDFICTLSQLTK